MCWYNVHRCVIMMEVNGADYVLEIFTWGKLSVQCHAVLTALMGIARIPSKWVPLYYLQPCSVTNSANQEPLCRPRLPCRSDLGLIFLLSSHLPFYLCHKHFKHINIHVGLLCKVSWAGAFGSEIVLKHLIGQILNFKHVIGQIWKEIEHCFPNWPIICILLKSDESDAWKLFQSQIRVF